MHEDSDGTFWLASKEAGLIHWNLETNAFKQYTIQNGLSNNNIYAVYSDDYNNLWLTSNYGLMRFNKETENVRVYLPKNGIAHEEFNTFAHFKDKDGTLYFGGLNGITVFHPKDLREEIVTEVPLRLIQIQVLNQQDSGFIDITKSFQTTNGIILEPTDRIIEIEVSLLDFENPTEIQYMYQIKGYQDQWLYTKSNRITFNNLPYGSYTINIKGKGLASGNSSNMLEIPVIVEKPFYLTWQFITIMILLLTLLIFGVVKWRISRLQKDRERLEKEVQVRTKRIENDKDIIEAQAESLKDLDKAKSHFFSNITHEFRTPLTLIIGPLEQLLDEQPPPTVFKRRMKGILKNANHILGLINQLLDISKIESGQMKLEIVHGDIIQYTDDIVKRFESLASQKKQRLAFIANRESWYVQFDQSKWDKIILNLLSNALKFTSKEGSIQVSLFSIIVNEKPYIKVCVSDLGIGINATDIDQIFNRFYQVDSSLRRMEEGTGIGLSLVKELVTFQGGEVKVFSVENQGTTFEIQLPVLEDQLELRSLDISNKDQPEVPIVDARINSSKLNSLVSENEALEILIVEDNIEMREYIRQCLKKPSYNITEAANGSEGLQKAQTIIPDLIISDVMMPKMDGYELTQSIRENISTSHIPLILLTAKSSLDSKLKGLKRGADAYLTKPFSPLELQINVQNLIEIRSSLQKRYGDKEISAANEIYEQEDEFITKLKNYILDNITEPNLNGDHIGRQFGLSRVHLYRKLKALTGYSITDFVKKIRLERALYLLKEGNLNVSEVADITGFSNISHFSSSFKKAYGKAPSQL
jgi:signal transduction histidine kinase/CheY-like chemotaxis protein